MHLDQSPCSCGECGGTMVTGQQKACDACLERMATHSMATLSVADGGAAAADIDISGNDA